MQLTETERKSINFIIIFIVSIIAIWASTILIRYYFREHMVRKKMRWSFLQDSFWNYDSIIKQAQDNYIKAQIFLNTKPVQKLKSLNPYNKARLRLFAKKIRSVDDVKFLSTYIVCFDDKKNDAEDSVAVYLKFRIRSSLPYEEILVMHREGQNWKITDYVKNPTVFMIAHSRSIIEKS